MQCVTNLCERGRCVGTQVEGVVGIDIRYDDFHAEVMSRTRSMCQGNTRWAHHTHTNTHAHMHICS